MGSLFWLPCWVSVSSRTLEFLIYFIFVKSEDNQNTKIGFKYFKEQTLLTVGISFRQQVLIQPHFLCVWVKMLSSDCGFQASFVSEHCSNTGPFTVSVSACSLSENSQTGTVELVSGQGEGIVHWPESPVWVIWQLWQRCLKLWKVSLLLLTRWMGLFWWAWKMIAAMLLWDAESALWHLWRLLC